MSNLQKGIGLILLSAFSFASMSALASLAGELPFFQKALFRNGVSMVISAMILLRYQRHISLPRQHMGLLTVRILCGIGGVFCNYYAINHLLLANSNSLSKLSPFFAILTATVFFKERIEKPQIICIFIALTGSVFLIAPGIRQFEAASLVGLLGGMFAGSAQASLRALRKRTAIDGPTLVFLFSLASTVFALIPSLVFWEKVTFRQLLLLLGVGCMGAVGQFAMTGAYFYAAPKDISIYDSSQILFSAVMGYLLFRQIPRGTDFIAYTLIILAAVLLFLHLRRTDKRDAAA